MREPILVGVMRRHPDAEVRVITATNETGTSARGFVAEMEESIAAERDALLAKFEALADRLATYDCTDAPDDVPLFVDVPDDYEAGVHAAAHDIRNLIKEARA